MGQESNDTWFPVFIEMYWPIWIFIWFVIFLWGFLFLKQIFFLIDSNVWIDLFFVISFIGNNTQYYSQNYKSNKEHGLLFGMECRYDKNPWHELE